jgi:hypothetical protein
VTDQVGKIYQLQENYDDNEYQVGSLAHLEKIELHIIAKKLDSIKAEVLLNEHKELRKQFLERRKSEPRKSRFYPAGGLPDDAVLVVRTNALIEFEQSLIGKSEATKKSPSTREHTSYLNIIGALMELIKSPKAGRSDDASVIRELVENYGDKYGISQSNLNRKIPEARRSLTAD